MMKTKRSPIAQLTSWFRQKKWKPFPFQQESWDAYLRGEHGLIHASTGTGKTYAAILGPILEGLAETSGQAIPTKGDDELDESESPQKSRASTQSNVSQNRRKRTESLRVLWITPLRALSNDTARAIEFPIADLGMNWSVGIRTGDTKASERNRQKKQLPTVLVTTPESLTLFLTRVETQEQFANLKAIIIDEWHELLSTKRGVQVELALARLKRLRPNVRIWGLSATLGNTEEAAQVLVGPSQPVTLIEGNVSKKIVVDSLIPKTMTRFPWAGHLGLTLVDQVVRAIEQANSCLVFTNTRSQTEIWYQAILQARPDWAGLMALHHGSLDRKVREWVEQALRVGELRCVVCTSSLDLGVDFSPVDRVIQIGSPKGVARLLQRAGRSGHQPKGVSRVTCVPTNALELIELSAARSAMQAKRIESRLACEKPFDVLAQHLVTCALADGFDADDLFQEVTTTSAYQHLTREEWLWTIEFVVRGGQSLRAYPDYHRLTRDASGRYVVTSKQIAHRHRVSIGTIVGESALQVKYQKGSKLGTIEESFASKLKPGDKFNFAGKVLEFIRIFEQAVYVRKAKGTANTVPRWMGGRMPLSNELADSVRDTLSAARVGELASAEMEAVKDILHTQAERSIIPSKGELLVELLTSREGNHCFLYPFEGRLVHEGLVTLLAYRLAQTKPTTLSMAVNDYGVEILSRDPLDLSQESLRTLLDPVRLEEDVLASMNLAELAKRQFREVARVAGLIFPGLPSASKSVKQLQSSANLFYDVFAEYDPDNLLLVQARREVLEKQFEERRLEQALKRIAQGLIVIKFLERPTPLAFPLMVDRMRESLSSEKLADRVRRLTEELER